MTRSVVRTARSAVVALLLGIAATLTMSPAQAANVVTPGNFTGYGFDQCLAPTQSAMDAWLKNSPFLSVGIYISGDSRACRTQPNLTRTWVSTQLRNGWRLLPITLGPQAPCNPRFPRYGNDETINPRPGANGKYGRARAQGRAEAVKAVAAANALGIAPRSTLWYDIEGFDYSLTRCRESALGFLSGWTFKLHELNFVSGVYSSVGSGIKILDDARVNRPNAFSLPDMIWLARWDGMANTSSSYIRSDGWRPGGRVKQYQGGHNETWGGVTINIDRNFLDVGKGSRAAAENHCNGTRISYPRYTRIAPGGRRRRHGQGTAVPAQGARRVRRPGQRHLQREAEDGPPQLAEEPRFRGPGHLEPAELDVAAGRRPEQGPQVGLGRPRGTPSPARSQRGPRRRGTERDRGVQEEHRGRAEHLPAAGGRQGQRDRRSVDVAGAEEREALTAHRAWSMASAGRRTSVTRR